MNTNINIATRLQEPLNETSAQTHADKFRRCGYDIQPCLKGFGWGFWVRDSTNQDNRYFVLTVRYVRYLVLTGQVAQIKCEN